MSDIVKGLILIGFVINLSACAIIKEFKGNSTAIKSESKQYHHTASDFKMAWDITQAGNDTVINGVITSVMNTQVLDVYLLVEVLDSDGSKLTGGDVSLDQVNLRRNDSATFSVKLTNTVLAKGDVLNFITNYRFASGSWGGSSRYSNFMVDATTGAATQVQKAQ